MSNDEKLNLNLNSSKKYLPDYRQPYNLIVSRQRLLHLTVCRQNREKKIETLFERASCHKIKTDLADEHMDMFLMLLTYLIACWELNIALFKLLLITIWTKISILRTFILSNGSQRKTRTSKPYQRPRNKAERVVFVHNLAPARNDTNAAGSVPSDVRTLTIFVTSWHACVFECLQWTVKKRYENASASVHVMKAMRFW